MRHPQRHLYIGCETLSAIYYSSGTPSAPSISRMITSGCGARTGPGVRLRSVIICLILIPIGKSVTFCCLSWRFAGPIRRHIRAQTTGWRVSLAPDTAKTKTSLWTQWGLKNPGWVNTQLNHFRSCLRVWIVSVFSRDLIEENIFTVNKA